MTVIWEVENTGEEDLYFSVGGHPAFMIPEQYDIVFNKDLRNHGETELEYVLIDPETAGVDAAHPRKLSLINGKIPYTRTLFDEDALIFDNTQVERVGVEVDGKPYVTLTCAGFPSVGVWCKPKADAPFVYLEPWIGRCDNVGFDGELKTKYGEQHLEGRRKFSDKLHHRHWRIKLDKREKLTKSMGKRTCVSYASGLKFCSFFTIISIKPKNACGLAC